MSRALQAEFFGASYVRFYRQRDFNEHYLECVRDASNECIRSLHFEERVELRDVSFLEETVLRKKGYLDRWSYAWGGTIKFYLRYQTPRGRLLEGVFETDGRSLYGITVYEVPLLRNAA
jgi:hypothetical protein